MEEYTGCETCKYFDLHPFIRDGDWTNYCELFNIALDNEGGCMNYEKGNN